MKITASELFVLTAACFCAATPLPVHAFFSPILVTTKQSPRFRSSGSYPQQQQRQQHQSSFTALSLALNKDQLRKREMVTVQQLVEEMSLNTDALLRAANNNNNSKKKKTKRTRKRVENPKQQYVYSSQRAAATNSTTEIVETTVNTDETKNGPLSFARSLGMDPFRQSCDVTVTNVTAEEEPRILGQVRVGEGAVTGTYAYILYKPAGWAILGGSVVVDDSLQKKNTGKVGQESVSLDPKSVPDGTVSVAAGPKNALAGRDKGERGYMKRVKYYDEESDLFHHVEYDERDIWNVMTPDEIAELKEEKRTGRESLLDEEGAMSAKRALEKMSDDTATTAVPQSLDIESKGTKMIVEEDLEEGASASSVTKTETLASFALPVRPCVVSWLKNLKASEGTPIRGGNNWKAVAGAVETDDTGLVLLCPKNRVNEIHVDVSTYIAVVGNGKHFAPKNSKNRQGVSSSVMGDVSMDIIAKLRKGRGDDTILVSKITISDALSTSNDAAQLCQKQFLDGIRGDAAANPLDRRADRRLIHCSSLSVSTSLKGLNDSDGRVKVLLPEVPNDIAIYSDRRKRFGEYSNLGSFLGRSSLRDNGLTNAYREINGAADGFPGWIVDRYDKWILVQHDQNSNRGPLPSIHDGNTVGVYYVASTPNRSSSSAADQGCLKPMLLEGKAAPDTFPILENGIVYHVSLGSNNLSTGIFLDQRSQRAWLSKYCNENTRILNCFAHCGAFSIAAATAGARTVSLDLNKKWLHRIEPQLLANGIANNVKERHDFIYGDCFDWLTRLAKRGEKFDIVILDPPSTSVGGKKKTRWSVKNDMDELVMLAAPLVKRGGLLWTTTNSASISIVKMAKMCKQGLDDANLSNARLERIAPMPVDFPSIGSHPIKNLVWRIPH